MADNGPSANRVDIVFLGDGYTSDQINTTYINNINDMLSHLFDDGEDPLPRYRNFFNVHRIDVVSKQSGADLPPLGIFRDTALDASYYFDGQTSRLLSVDSGKVADTLAAALPGAPFVSELTLVPVNDSRYGGGATDVAVYAAGHRSGPEAALHEIGHTFANLADEYGGIKEQYQGPEPDRPNLTTSDTGEKWSQWVGYVQPGIGVIKAHEGAGYYDRGLYRPSANSKMRTLGRPFDAIAREQIVLDIYNLVDPLDGWMDNSNILADPEQLWVDVVDPHVIDVQWLIDGQPLAGADDEILTLADYNLAEGDHTITARAFDPTDWVRINNETLEQLITWQVDIPASRPIPEPTTLCLLAVGLFAVTRTRRI
jgi:hypothetical protein